MDTISQRELTLRLKHACDVRSRSMVRSLAQENPRSIWSSRVLTNIGTRRMKYLMQVVEDVPAHVRVRAGHFHVDATHDSFVAKLRAMSPDEFDRWVEESGYGDEIRAAHASAKEAL